MTKTYAFDFEEIQSDVDILQFVEAHAPSLTWLKKADDNQVLRTIIRYSRRHMLNMSNTTNTHKYYLTWKLDKPTQYIPDLRVSAVKRGNAVMNIINLFLRRYQAFTKCVWASTSSSDIRLFPSRKSSNKS